MMKFIKFNNQPEREYPYFGEYCGILEEFQGLTVLFLSPGEGVVVKPTKEYKMGTYHKCFADINFTKISGALTFN